MVRAKGHPFPEQTQSPAACPASSDTSGILGVPPHPLPEHLPKLGLASQEQLMVEHQPLGWEQRLGWGLRGLCLVAAAMCGGTLPMPAPPSSTRLTQLGVFPEVAFQMLGLCGSRLGARPARWALAVWQEETCLLQDAYTIWRHCSIT